MSDLKKCGCGKTLSHEEIVYYGSTCEACEQKNYYSAEYNNEPKPSTLDRRETLAWIEAMREGSARMPSKVKQQGVCLILEELKKAINSGRLDVEL